MKDFKRRDFLKTAAGVAAGTALGTGSMLLPGEAVAQTYKAAPEKGAKLRVLRWKRFVQGDEDVWAANTKKFTADDGHRGSRRRRGLGRRSAEGCRRGQRRQRARHHHQHHGGRAPVSRQAGRRHRRCQLSRQQVRRLVRGIEGVRHGRQEVGCDHDGRRRQCHGLSRELDEGGRVRHLSEGHARVSETLPGAEGKGHAGRICARQRDRRLELDALAGVGVRRQAGRRKEPTSSSTARRRSPRSSTASSSTRHSFPERCPGSTRTTTRPSSTASFISPPTASRSITRRRRHQIRSCRKWRRISSMRRSRWA